MTKVFEVMTRSLATCVPDARVSDVASTMRERDIGSVLIVKDGQPYGIVTDRDLVLHALSGADGAPDAPVHKYMSSPVITGEADWSLERASDVMAKHQIRRLPIVENGHLTGIISLGDVALHTGKKQKVGKSLEAISQPGPNSLLEQLGAGRLLTAFALAASATTVFAMLTMNGRGNSNWRKKAEKSELYHTARKAIDSARTMMGEAAQSDTVRDVRDQMLSKLNDLSDQVAALQPKPKRRHFWIV